MKRESQEKVKCKYCEEMIPKFIQSHGMHSFATIKRVICGKPGCVRKSMAEARAKKPRPRRQTLTSLAWGFKP